MTQPNVTYTRTFPDLNGSTVKTSINNRYPECIYQDANSVDIVWTDNYPTPPGGGGIGVGFFKHVVTARNHGGVSLWHDVDLQSELQTGFNLSHTQVTHSKRINGGVADALWWNSFGPNSNFATQPDAAGIVHEFKQGWVRIGEINYGNAWGDFGLLADRAGPSRVVCGLEFVPDWLPGSDGDTAYRKYHAAYAYSVCSGGPGAQGNEAKHWIGALTCLNSIVGKNDHKTMLPGAATGNTSGGGGYAYQVNGSLDPANPIGKGMNFTHAMDVAIDTREATFTDGAILMNDDQPIKLGSVWLRGHQGHVQVSADSVNWRNL
jgi:hypothetical protein